MKWLSHKTWGYTPFVFACVQTKIAVTCEEEIINDQPEGAEQPNDQGDEGNLTPFCNLIHLTITPSQI